MCNFWVTPWERNMCPLPSSFSPFPKARTWTSWWSIWIIIYWTKQNAIRRNPAQVREPSDMSPTSTVLHRHPATPGSPAERGGAKRWKLHHGKPHLKGAGFVEPSHPKRTCSPEGTFMMPGGWLPPDTKKSMGTNSQGSSSKELPQAKLEHRVTSLAESEARAETDRSFNYLF